MSRGYHASSGPKLQVLTLQYVASNLSLSYICTPRLRVSHLHPGVTQIHQNNLLYGVLKVAGCQVRGVFGWIRGESTRGPPQSAVHARRPEFAQVLLFTPSSQQPRYFLILWYPISFTTIAMYYLFGSTTVAAAFAACLAWAFWKVFLEPSILPDLLIAGLDQSQWFAWPRTILRAFNSYREIYGEAYEKVCLFAVFLLLNLGRGKHS